MTQIAMNATQETWQTAGLAELIDRIETSYHANLRTSLPRLEQTLEKLSARHGGRHPELAQLHRLLSQFHADLIVHMFKEEHVLFMLCRRLEEATPAARAYDGSIQKPVEAMRHEHEVAAQDLAHMREVARRFVPGPGVVRCHRMIVAALAKLEAEMLEHMHKENTLLFPRALAVEAQLQNASAAAATGQAPKGGSGK